MHPLFLSHIVPNPFYALFSRFPWSTLLPFPSYFKLHNLTYLGIDVSTDDVTLPPQMALNYISSLFTTTPTLSRRTSVDTFINRSHRIYHPDHATLHLTRPRLICNSKFPRFTTVQQNWSNTAINPRLMIETKFRDNFLIMIRLLKLFK